LPICSRKKRDRLSIYAKERRREKEGGEGEELTDSGGGRRRLRRCDLCVISFWRDDDEREGRDE